MLRVAFALLQTVYIAFPSFESLSFAQSDFGMDVSSSSRALVIAAPTAHASTAATPAARTSTAATPRLSTRRTRVTRSRNHQRMITWMRQRIIDLEKVVKTKQAEIDKLKARPAPSFERELYLLSKIELIGRQLESEYPRVCPSFRVYSWLSLFLIFPLLACSGQS